MQGPAALGRLPQILLPMDMHKAALSDLSLPLKLLVVGVLYFAEGVPYGFVVTTLSFYLRTQGVPLEQIGLLSLLGLAWSLKLIWSPLVDRFGATRAAWLVPAQVTIILCLMGLTYQTGQPATLGFWVLVGLLCIASATQDLAVDAYTIDLLETRELGIANGVRNGTYRAGALAAGSGLLIASDLLGWRAAFVGLVAVMAALIVTILVFRPFRLPRLVTDGANPGQQGGWRTVSTAYRTLRRHPYFWAIVLFTLTYKAGDALMATMISPFWKDQGFSATQFGTVSGILGAVATILGGLVGGVLTSRWGIGRGIWTMGMFQAFSNLGYWAAALPGMSGRVLFELSVPLAGRIVPVYPIYLASQGESFSSGLGSAAFMAFLMSLCDKRFSAMHYAFFAMLFSFGARIFGYLGGWGAAYFGYADFFFLSFLAAWPAFVLLPWVLPVVRSIEGENR
ncbi:MAG: MFS transporter [Deltaproteobacteria bacterium]|nr:MFS transporter [Deltaproteobacteria bacterium]